MGAVVDWSPWYGEVLGFGAFVGGTLSTAEAISVVNSGLALAAHFNDGRLHANDIALGLIGAVIKDPVQDRVVSVWNRPVGIIICGLIPTRW